MLHLETVSDELRTLIQAVCQQPKLTAFRLVGGTALSLYMGHRISVDADFFTDRSFDKRQVEQTLVDQFPGIMKVQEAAYGFTWVYQQLKIDFYDWKVPFLKLPHIEHDMRLASPEDIAAYKLDAIVGRKTEKDYRDVAELLTHYSLSEMLGFYKEKYPYNNPKLVVDHLAAVQHVQAEETLLLLKEQPWANVETAILSSLNHYVNELLSQKEKVDKQRDERLMELLMRKNKPASD
jgi:predicted nucleotidyltransferase component of viral defense system